MRIPLSPSPAGEAPFSAKGGLASKNALFPTVGGSPQPHNDGARPRDTAASNKWSLTNSCGSFRRPVANSVDKLAHSLVDIAASQVNPLELSK